MGKPLLTDEMIERAQRGEDISDGSFYDVEETKILHIERSDLAYDEEYEDTLPIKVEPSVIKSRRIENEKRNLFQSKLNKILAVMILLLILLLIAIFKL